MLLQNNRRNKNNFLLSCSKSLSLRKYKCLVICIPSYLEQFLAKAPEYVCPKGSFTVESAFVLPIFLFAAVVVLGLFPLLLVEQQVNAGLQYAARIAATSYQEEGEGETLLSLTETSLLFYQYLSEHELETSVLPEGILGISLLESDFSGDYVELTASYQVELPISFWKLTSLPVTQRVKMKKWTGAAEDTDDGTDTYVYITPSGTAYHRSTECSYLNLSIQAVSVSTVGTLRNKSGGIYYACTCYEGGSLVYITDYGTEYHGSLSCSGLKRTIYQVLLSDVGDRHACSKCW